MKFDNKGRAEKIIKFFKEGSPFNEVNYLATSEFGDENRLVEKMSIANSSEQVADYRHFGLDIGDMTSSLMIEEMRSSVIKTLLRKCMQTKDILFIDASGKNDLEIGQYFAEAISVENLSNIIVNVNLGACLQDSHFYRPLQKPNLGKSTSTVYHIGTIEGCKIYIDPMMRYTDDEFISFNTIDVQIFDVKLVNVVDEATFAPRTVGTVDYTYNIHFPKKIMVLMDNCKNPGKFKAYQRNDKLSVILKKN